MTEASVRERKRQSGGGGRRPWRPNLPTGASVILIGVTAVPCNRVTRTRANSRGNQPARQTSSRLPFVARQPPSIEHFSTVRDFLTSARPARCVWPAIPSQCHGIKRRGAVHTCDKQRGGRAAREGRCAYELQCALVYVTGKLSRIDIHARPLFLLRVSLRRVARFFPGNLRGPIGGKKFVAERDER